MRLITSLGLLLLFQALVPAAQLQLAASLSSTMLKAEKLPGVRARNVIFILADDHRFDAMSFMGHPYVETPNLDLLAKNGVHLKNAFVTTSLCSPSRATILTGLYAHKHRVVDNYNPVDTSLVFFPQYLQRAGYETAFIGKWHMGGEHDEPQRGFDHWLGFKGQGSYWADGRGTTRVVPQTSQDGYNLNGRRLPQKGYITDELTDYALDWLNQRSAKKPFFLYLSHKAVHSDFVAADRHRGRYQGKRIPLPSTYADTEANYADKPMWLKNQRNSRHGVDFAYNLPSFDMQEYHRRYCETLLAIDENVGRLLHWLRSTGRLESTLVVYMGDNGFQFGEHGLIDKRTAYEASMRVPLLLHCPELFKPGTVVTQMVSNIDIAPSLLEAAGAKTPLHMDGQSFLPLARGQSIPWRQWLLYEYFWERNYPQTPTMHAVRGDRYKYIRYHGVWDVDELYDLQNDPAEARNLIRSPEHQQLAKEMNQRLFELLKQSSGGALPIVPDVGETFPYRRRDGAKPAEFPKGFIK